MKIGMVLAKPYPPDIRVKKEADVLIRAGYEVGLVALNRGEDIATETSDNGLRVFRATLAPQSFVARQIKGITLLEKAWLEPITRFVAEYRPDVLHVHDFPMVYTVLKVAKPLQLPVVADLHENMPAAFKIWRADYSPLRRMKDAVFHNYYLWRWHEKRILPHCDRVIVVVPEAAERLLQDGLPKDKITVVSNTEDETTFRLAQPDQTILKRYEDKWVASYVGGVGPHRGVDTVIRATPIAARHIPSFRLLIVGVRGQRQLDVLMRVINKAAAGEYIDVVPWQPFDRVSSYIQASAVCLVPHADSEHTQTTVPHKLFQYMIAGRPVIVSNVRPLQRIINEAQAGVVFEAGNAASLSDALIRLYREPDLAQRLAQNGERAATGKFSWRHDARRLLDLYDQIEKEEGVA